MAKRSNGEGSIYKRADGRWCGSYYVGGKRKSVYGKTRKDVKELLEQRMQEKEEQQHEICSVENWIKEYLENYKRNELKASTYGTYLVYYRKHILESEIGKKNLNELKTDDLQHYYNRMQNEGLSAKTIRHLSVIINEALNQAVRMDKIKVNVNSAVVLPKKAKFTGEVLSKEDVVKLTTEAKGESLYPLVMLTIFTGMRKGEVLGLTWDNVHWEGRYLEVKKSLCRVVDRMDEQGKMSTKLELMEPKNKSSIRKIPLNDLAFDILHTHYKRQLEQKTEWQEIYTDRNLVFAKMDGDFISPRGMLFDYYKLLEKYNLPRVRFHDLRHTFASLLLESEIEAKVIQELLGHSSISTTLDIYSHLTMGQKQKSVDKLAELLKKNA